MRTYNVHVRAVDSRPDTDRWRIVSLSPSSYSIQSMKHLSIFPLPSLAVRINGERRWSRKRRNNKTIARLVRKGERDFWNRKKNNNSSNSGIMEMGILTESSAGLAFRAMQYSIRNCSIPLPLSQTSRRWDLSKSFYLARKIPKSHSNHARNGRREIIWK